MNIWNLASYEKEEIILGIISNNLDVTMKKLIDESTLNRSTLTKILNNLIKKDKIRRLKFGNAYLYKVR